MLNQLWTYGIQQSSHANQEFRTLVCTWDLNWLKFLILLTLKNKLAIFGSLIFGVDKLSLDHNSNLLRVRLANQALHNLSKCKVTICKIRHHLSFTNIITYSISQVKSSSVQWTLVNKHVLEAPHQWKAYSFEFSTSHKKKKEKKKYTRTMYRHDCEPVVRMLSTAGHVVAWGVMPLTQSLMCT